MSFVSGYHRVFRGGSWFFGPLYARVAFRNDFTPDNRLIVLGLRLVRRCT
jgi:formylglycine-generating enzyme required for sulfatase activity